MNLSSPVVLLLWLRLVNIPLQEACYEGNLEHKEYQRTTNAFVPWCSKKRKIITRDLIASAQETYDTDCENSRNLAMIEPAAPDESYQAAASRLPISRDAIYALNAPTLS